MAKHREVGTIELQDVKSAEKEGAAPSEIHDQCCREHSAEGRAQGIADKQDAHAKRAMLLRRIFHGENCVTALRGHYAKPRCEEWAEEIGTWTSAKTWPPISGVFTGSTNGRLTWRSARNRDSTPLSGGTARFR